MRKPLPDQTTHSVSEAAYRHYLTHQLTLFSQNWFEASEDGFASLATEVLALTHGQARLCAVNHPAVAAHKRTLQLTWNHHQYGTLHFPIHADPSISPSLSLDSAQHLANLCSWLLYLQGEHFVLASLHHPDTLQRLHGLTPQQHMILQFLRQPLSDKEIAQTSGLALGTVRRHMANIYARLGIHSRVEARILCLHAEHIQGSQPSTLTAS